MDIRELCTRYQHAVSNKDLAGVEELFLPDAVIDSPIMGITGIRDFHAYLFQQTRQTSARFPNVFEEKTNPPRISLQFSYTFLTQSVALGGIDGIAIFEFDEIRQRFKSLKIVYDPSGIRKLMESEDIALPQHAITPQDQSDKN